MAARQILRGAPSIFSLLATCSAFAGYLMRCCVRRSLFTFDIKKTLVEQVLVLKSAAFPKNPDQVTTSDFLSVLRTLVCAESPRRLWRLRKGVAIQNPLAFFLIGTESCPVATLWQVKIVKVVLFYCLLEIADYAQIEYCSTSHCLSV